MARRKNPLLVPFSPENVYEPGSAMASLTERQRKFVEAKVHLGLSNADAARAAGYSTTGTVPRNTGYNLAHHSGVQAAILEESRRLMRSEGPRSILTLVEIRDDREADRKDRIRAAELLLNRGGFNAVSESTVTVNHQLSEAEKDAAILKLLVEGGVPLEHARGLLIDPDALEMTANRIGVYELEPKPPSQVTPERRAQNRAAGQRRLARQKMTQEERDADRARVRQERSERMSERRKREYAELQARRAAEENAPEYVDINLSDDTTDPLDEIQDVL